ncbi:MAG: ATP-binding protein, partial [Chloroflexota bacterium]
VLHVYGEHAFAVPPLALPDASRHVPVEQLARWEAVCLFVERARAARADFWLSDENAPAVAEICRRLDGLPLAIELAAARSRLFSPHALAARLRSHRLPLLVGGASNLPVRQQTLRSTIAWSHDLLTGDERVLFRRLAVFVGGCTVDAAEAVCGEDGLDVVGVLSSLADQSLLRPERTDDGEPWFAMLETVREFALERLDASAEADAVRRRHADFFLALAEEVDSHIAGGIAGGDQVVWLDRQERDYDNTLAALEWWQDRGVAEHALRLGAALSWFWFVRRQTGEGRQRLLRVLAMPGADRPTAARAHALRGLGHLTWQEGPAYHAECRSLDEESVALFRQLGDTAGLTRALGLLAMQLASTDDHAALRATSEELLALSREWGDWLGTTIALQSLGGLALKEGDHDAARSLMEEAVAISRETENGWRLGMILGQLGHVERAAGNLQLAGRHYDESLAIRRAMRNKSGIATALTLLAEVAREQSDYHQAAAHYEEAEAILTGLGRTQPAAAVRRRREEARRLANPLVRASS